MPNPKLEELAKQIHVWALDLGFQQAGITRTQLDKDEAHLQRWLESRLEGSMAYMRKHGLRRSRPAELVPGTRSIISVRMDYLPEETRIPVRILDESEQAYVSRYALGRDYHKLIRGRLKQLLTRIERFVAENNLAYQGSRLFTDSAPVLEKAIARNAGLGWIGKHTLLINPQAGSFFFLGEILTSLELPFDSEFQTDHCGNCTSCLDICPTQALLGPRQLDARRCISYLTIEHKGRIDPELRSLMGNRIFGCDDCQLICPWNKFARFTKESDFSPRYKLDQVSLLALYFWKESEFLKRTTGSAIRRAGFQGWRRNLMIALGNSQPSREVIKNLEHPGQEAESEMVAEHRIWALDKQKTGLLAQKKSSF